MCVGGGGGGGGGNCKLARDQTTPASRLKDGEEWRMVITVQGARDLAEGPDVGESTPVASYLMSRYRILVPALK